MSGTVFATGVAKRLSIVEEATFGTSPVTGSKYWRRVTSDLALGKDTFESQEIMPSMQIRDARHGVRRPQGTIAGQISPGSYNDLWQSLFRQNFATGAIMASAAPTLTIGANATLVVASGYTAAGLKKGDIIRMSGVTGVNSAINGQNMRINNLTDTTITTRDLPTGMTSGALTAGSINVVGKKCRTVPTGAIFKSYSIEHWFSDVAISELFTGCRFGQTDIAMPASGLVTFTAQTIGQQMTQTVTQALTTPTGPTTSSSLAAVNGKVDYNGTDIAAITGINMQIAPAMEAPAVVGSYIVPFIFQGNIRVSGSFTCLFYDETIPVTFFNEVEVGLNILLTTGPLSTADFIRISLPRVKLMSNTRSDGQMSLVGTFNFTALENVADPLSDLSTIVVQDSLA